MTNVNYPTVELVYSKHHGIKQRIVGCLIDGRENMEVVLVSRETNVLFEQ